MGRRVSSSSPSDSENVIDADAAFGAAVRQIQRGTFDGQSMLTGHHFIGPDQRQDGSEHRSLPGPGEVVLHAISFEMTNSAIIHLVPSNTDDQSAFGWRRASTRGDNSPRQGHTLDLLQVGALCRCAAI